MNRDAETLARVNLGTGQTKSPLKLVDGLKGEKLVFAEGAFEANSVLYLRNCVDCDFVVNVHSAKVLVEGCTNCRVALNGKVITSSSEVWKCTSVKLQVNIKMAMQLDLCTDCNVTFARVAELVQIVWAGLNNFQLSFQDGDTATHPTLVTGVEQRRLVHPDGVNVELDQFIIRTIDGKLLEERIVRLPNGFPTTDREADLFDEDQKRKEKSLTEMAKKLIAENPAVFANAKKAKEPKVKDNKPKPNEPCHCGSKTKYKKCCMAKDEALRNKSSVPERKPNLGE